MGGEEEEEWNSGEDFTTELRAAPMGWSAIELSHSRLRRGQDTLLRIKLESRDYSLRQFSETVLDAQAMIQLFSLAPSSSRAPLREYESYLYEELAETIEVRAVSLNSPLEILYVVGSGAVALAYVLNRWITLKTNWEKSRTAKAKADRAQAEADSARANAEVGKQKAELHGVAMSFVKEHIERERGKALDELSPKHPLRIMATRTVLALAELEIVSSEVDKGK